MSRPSFVSPVTSAPGRLYWSRQILAALFSFECLVILSAFADAVQFFIPWHPPFPLAIVPAAIAVPIGAAIVWRHGLYLPGMATASAYLMFVAWTIASMGWSPSRVLAKQILMYELTFLLWFIVATSFVVARDRTRVVRMIIVFAIMAVLLSFAGLWISYFHGNFKYTMATAIEGTTNSRAYNRVGYSVAFGSVVLFGIASLSRLWSAKQLLSASLCAVGFLFLLVGGSRGALLSALGGCLFVMLVMNLPSARGRPRLWTSQGIIFVVVVAVAIGLVIIVNAGVELTTLNRALSYLRYLENPEISLRRDRVQYFTSALEHWYSSPWIGLGMAGFNMVDGRGEMPGAHPHNIILEILVNYGVIGLIFFGLFVWTGLRNMSVRRLSTDLVMMIVGAVFFTAFVASMGSQDLIRHDVLMMSIALMTCPPLESPSPARRSSLDTSRRRRAESGSALPVLPKFVRS